jgi:hypothetical protein
MGGGGDKPLEEGCDVSLPAHDSNVSEIGRMESIN